MDVGLRPAGAGDVESAVPLIHSSGPDAFNYTFGDALAFLRHAFLDGAGEFGYGNHVVAIVGEEVVGIGTAFSGDRVGGFTWEITRQILRHFGVRAPSVLARGIRTERIIRPPTKEVQYIGHLGVAESMRGRGIGTMLIERFVTEGRELGRRTVELDVAVTNPDAQRLYERLGFRVATERVSKLSNTHGAVPGHRRLVLPL